MICCVRRASCAESGVGSARASSFELVWSDCVPPRTAASAWNAVRTMWLSGCCAVSVAPPVCVWKRSIMERGSVAPKRSLAMCAQRRRAARHFAISSRKGAGPGGGEPRRNLVEPEAGGGPAIDVGGGVAEREADLLRGRAAVLAHVVAADADRV